YIEGLEHVLAHEIGKVAHRLHRHRLVKEVERLVALDAEPPSEGGAIGREAVVDLNRRHRAQSLFQRCDIASEVLEMLGDGKFDVGDNIKSRRLSLRLTEP